jgi:hypothetical protein
MSELRLGDPRRGRPQPRGDARVRWGTVLARAREIAESDEHEGLGLRGLFYRLVSEVQLPNTLSYYKSLSRYTARARREDGFPDLVDRGRTIHRPKSWASPQDAKRWLIENYLEDRTRGQPCAIYIAVEKHALVTPLQLWFERFGVPVIALGGYASESLAKQTREDKHEQAALAVAGLTENEGRKSVLIYAGDFDPSGEDIDRDFIKRAGGFDVVERVALTPEQVTEFDLPPQMGKENDARAPAFVARHGRLVQVELDALPLSTLRDLYVSAFACYFDMAKYEQAMAAERANRRALADDLGFEIVKEAPAS